MPLMSSHQILNKHTIINMFYLKWTSHHNSQLGFLLRCEIALRNLFSQNKSAIIYIWNKNMCNIYFFCQGFIFEVNFDLVYIISIYIWFIFRVI